MTYFGKVALKAVALMAQENSAKEAWRQAVKDVKYDTGESYEISCGKKTCPKNTFLALIQAGKIKDPTDTTMQLYDPTIQLDARSNKTREHALGALQVLAKLPSRDRIEKSKDLWKLLPSSNYGAKKHQGQMDVVLGLYDAGLLIFKK